MTVTTLKEAIVAMPRADLVRHRCWYRIVRERAEIEVPPRGQRPTGFCIRQIEGREPKVDDLVIARSYAVTARFQVRSGPHAVFRITQVGGADLRVVPELQTTTLGPVLRRALHLLPVGKADHAGGRCEEA
jgi:hypothetical protein